MLGRDLERVLVRGLLLGVVGTSVASFATGILFYKFVIPLFHKPKKAPTLQ